MWRALVTVTPPIPGPNIEYTTGPKTLSALLINVWGFLNTPELIGGEPLNVIVELQREPSDDART
jgi:hypothetical protein